MMTSAQVVETSVTTTDNSPSQDYTHPETIKLHYYRALISINDKGEDREIGKGGKNNDWLKTNYQRSMVMSPIKLLKISEWRTTLLTMSLRVVLL